MLGYQETTCHECIAILSTSLVGACSRSDQFRKQWKYWVAIQPSHRVPKLSNQIWQNLKNHNSIIWMLCCLCLCFDPRWVTTCLHYTILTDPGFEPRTAHQSKDLDHPHLDACLFHRPHPSGRSPMKAKLRASTPNLCKLCRCHTTRFLGSMTSVIGLGPPGTNGTSDWKFTCQDKCSLSFWKFLKVLQNFHGSFQ